MNLKKKCVIIPLIMLVAFCSCGAIFSASTPKLNIDKKPVYARCLVDEVIKASNSNYDETSREYTDVDIVDSGVVKSKDKNQKSLRVVFRTFEVTVRTQQKAEAALLSEGDRVTVYGKLQFGSGKNRTVYVYADHLVKQDTGLSQDYYIYGGRKGYSIKNSLNVGLADNRIKFMIPSEWAAAEADGYEKIFNAKIYSEGAGKCYYINGLSGEKEPEVFCAFYFDNNIFLKNSGDKDNTGEIEKEIVNNICPSERSAWKLIFPTERSTSSKGVRFDHYVANFDNYRVEFAFTPVKGADMNDNGGICVLIHMYIDDSITPDDILYVMSTLSVG